MKKIPLSNSDQFALVDDHVFEWASKFKWYALKDRNTSYVVRLTHPSEGKKVRVSLHREILKAPSGVQVDHKDGDGFNNLDENIRTATHRQNMRNRQKNLDSFSQYKGVVRKIDNRPGRPAGRVRWHARIRVHGYRISLGCFTEEADAARAYDKAAIIFHGDFARTNFPRENYEKS